MTKKFNYLLLLGLAMIISATSCKDKEPEQNKPIDLVGDKYTDGAFGVTLADNGQGEIIGTAGKLKEGAFSYTSTKENGIEKLVIKQGENTVEAAIMNDELIIEYTEIIYKKLVHSCFFANNKHKRVGTI